MKGTFRFRAIDAMVVLAIAGYAGYQIMARPPASDQDVRAFAQQVNLEPLYRTAVQADGRLRSFESHAKTYMGYVSGPRKIHGQSYGFTYLDLLFQPEAYADEDIVFIKNKLVLQQMLDVIAGHAPLDPKRAGAIKKSRLVSRAFLRETSVAALLSRLEQDLIRTNKEVDSIHGALAVSEPRFLAGAMRMVVPQGADANTQWVSIGELMGMRGAPQDAAHAGLGGPAPVPGVDSSVQSQLATAWSELRESWRKEDAATVNGLIAQVAELIRSTASDLYPSPGRLAMESWYFRNHSMTWVWLLYLASVLPLLMSVIHKWQRARTIGMVLFVVAFGFHTASLLVRWYISGRWPNANMFEAVTTSAWFGGVGALVIEWLARKTALRNIFALGSAIMSMIALMAAYFLPTGLDSSINNKMAALNDIWLYIHTNVIIWSYAVIGLACVPALLLLRERWCRMWDSGHIPRWRLLLLPVALGVLNYTGYKLLMHVIAHPQFGLADEKLFATIACFWGSLMFVLLEALAARSRRKEGLGIERSASGGASSILMGSGGASSFLRREGPTAGQVYDGATMVLVEVAFIMLWTGTVMGAIWADHSWGRPWGWDPKEVFALNTFIIFLILVHVRLKVRDKAFHTAILAVIGFQVMLFNWIAVNFVITGLHSYA